MFILNKISKRFEFDLIRIDLFFVTLALFLIGAITFFSASLGILNRNEIKFYNIIESQVIAYSIGLFLFFIGYIVNKKYIECCAPYLFLFSIFLSLSVFIDNFGMNFGGSTRWINYMGVSFQPGELLKIALIMMLSFFMSNYFKKNNLKYSFKNIFMLLFILVLPSIVIFLQKDLGTLLILFAISFSILLVSNLKLRYLLIIASTIALCSAFYIYSNEYVKNRIFDFKSTIKNEQGISYQNKQALISIGNGEVFGRGIGQSVQKFYYLPEPVGDSIFAVYLEEYGFVGGIIVMLLFLYFILRVYVLSFASVDLFTKYYLSGFAMLIFVQTFLNMGSMLSVIPISGDTLPLFSQGGTALLCNMFSIGFMLQLTKKK